ncbi:MAG: hypothetical protein ACM3SQ_03060 [Betaproteobacteria bacterium]
MERIRESVRQGLVTAVTLSLLCAMTGCNSGESKKAEEAETPATATNQAPVGNAVISADYCLATFMQKSPGFPVHFVYKAVSSDGETKSYEGDITAEAADFTLFSSQPSTPDLAENPSYKIHDGKADFTNTFHYTHADEHEWATAATMPIQGTTPWSVFVDKPPIDRVGPDSVNGFETIKYTVDNSKQSLADRVGVTDVKDHLVNGTVWLTKDTGCILQWTMDASTEHKDGTISRVHYEGVMKKK